MELVGLFAASTLSKLKVQVEMCKLGAKQNRYLLYNVYVCAERGCIL